jgi:5-methylcytosine-specific restriction protein B
LVAYLGNRLPTGGQPTINLGPTVSQFGTASGTTVDESLPQDLAVEWVTFHQSYTYEEFIVGRRPKPMDGGIILEPIFGVLMSIALSIDQPDGPSGYLLIIDEINRANASQVFGEFITLLDPEYRATVAGLPNPDALKIHLPGVAYENGESEEITMLRGGKKLRLSEDWAFPEHLYVLATMNSVDKAALPLDSALTRRFYRIEMPPDLNFLAKNLGVDLERLAIQAQSIREGLENITSLTAGDTSILLLDRVNVMIATEVGEDFELGHTLLRRVATPDENARWVALIDAWDHSILPQIMERYAGRDDSLRDLLKVAPGSPTSDAFGERAHIGAEPALEGPLQFKRLGNLEATTAQNILRQLSI